MKILGTTGTTSHFNEDTWYDWALFASMGVGIVTLTVIMVLVLALFYVLKVELPRVFRWGIQAGFILFVVGLIPGWMMIYNESHTVPRPRLKPRRFHHLSAVGGGLGRRGGTFRSRGGRGVSDITGGSVIKDGRGNENQGGGEHCPGRRRFCPRSEPGLQGPGRAH